MPIAARFILVLLALGGAGNALAALTADYRFQNTLASSVGTAPELTNVGAGNGFAIETVDGQSRTVLTFPQHNGLQLTPTNGITANGGATYTIVLLARLADINRYRRYINFEHTTSDPDNGLYNYSGDLIFYNSSSDPSGSGAPITAGAYHQVVITRDSGGSVVGYVDGMEQFSFTDSAEDGIINANTLRFFIDDGSEDSAGAVARIRVFNNVLTPAQVAALDRDPGGVSAAPIPTLSPSALAALMLLLGAAALATGRARRSPRKI